MPESQQAFCLSADASAISPSVITTTQFPHGLYRRNTRLALFFLLLTLMGCLKKLYSPKSYSLSASPIHSLTECGVLKRSGKYRLEADASSPGTCFSVQADNVSLDLNGKTVTYGTGTASIPVYGILGVACWDPDYGVGNPCGGSASNLAVYGGTITQGANAAAFSHAIRLGQLPRGAGPTVQDVIFNISAKSSIPLYLTYAGTGAQIFNNTFHNDVSQIDNRNQLRGQSIKLGDSSHIPGPANIFGNRIIGGAQGGIFSAVPATTIHHNLVSQKGTYTNDFGIYAW